MRILVGKYCNFASFLTVTATSSSSHGWKGILKGRDLLLDHLGKVIGDGESTSVWKDAWLDPGSDLKTYGPILEQPQEWNKDKVNNILPEVAE